MNDNDNDNDNDTNNLVPIPSQPIMYRAPSQKCEAAEECEDYQTFVELFRVIKGKAPELPIDKHNHCILYHVEDFPKQCQCEQWDDKSTEDQHIIHGHWFHRYALNKLENEKKYKQRRKATTSQVGYGLISDKSGSGSGPRSGVRLGRKLQHTATLKSVLAKPNEEFEQLQFGAPYNVERIDAKFKNPKDEMLNNEYRPLRSSEWNDLLRKCVLFAKAVQARTSNLNVKQIVALKLYTGLCTL